MSGNQGVAGGKVEADGFASTYAGEDADDGGLTDDRSLGALLRRTELLWLDRLLRSR